MEAWKFCRKVKLIASNKQVGQAGVGIVTNNVISAGEVKPRISLSLNALWRLDVCPTVLSNGEGKKSVHSDLLAVYLADSCNIMFS